jgi:pyruvate kinase
MESMPHHAVLVTLDVHLGNPCHFFQAAASSSTMIYRSTKIGLDTVLDREKFRHIVRKTKIVCTIGPACSSEDMMQKLIQTGMNIARLNFSHGTHASHLEVLQRLRGVATKAQSHLAFMLDTKGPEIRTAMLRQGKTILLQKGQTVVVEAVGDRYTEFEGFKTESETRIGVSYAKLCRSVSAGSRILLADGSITIVVNEILSSTELKGTVLNTMELGQRKNVNLPGVRVDLPVLLDKDIDDLQNFGCKHGLDFVAASFVQSKEDVLFIRSVLDKAGGHAVKIISKIENQEGLRKYDEILDVTDGACCLIASTIK